jgi:hypothetical protein
MDWENSIGRQCGIVSPVSQKNRSQRWTGRNLEARARPGPLRPWVAAGRILNQTFLCALPLIRRNCVQRLGGFDPGIRLGEDVDFFGRAMREFGTDFLDRTTLHYRIGSPSLMPQC